MRRIRNTIWRWAIDRMLRPIYAKQIHYEYDLNPEDWDQVAYFMLIGLLGRDGGKPTYTDVGGRTRPPRDAPVWQWCRWRNEPGHNPTRCRTCRGEPQR